MNNINSAQTNINNPRGNLFSLVLLFVFIVFDIVCDNIILINFGLETPPIEMGLFLGFLFLQIIASPVQAGLSDFYGRKKGLIFSISASLLALVLLFLYSSKLFPYFLLLAMVNVIKGFCGNITPMVWSAIGDTESKNERFFFAIAESAYAIGYLLLLFVDEMADKNNYLIILILITPLIIYFCKKKV